MLKEKLFEWPLAVLTASIAVSHDELESIAVYPREEQVPDVIV